MTVCLFRSHQIRETQLGSNPTTAGRRILRDSRETQMRIAMAMANLAGVGSDHSVWEQGFNPVGQGNHSAAKVKMRFQSFFMLMTVQLLAFASS